MRVNEGIYEDKKMTKKCFLLEEICIRNRRSWRSTNILEMDVFLHHTIKPLLTKHQQITCKTKQSKSNIQLAFLEIHKIALPMPQN